MKNDDRTILDLKLKMSANLWYALEEIIQLSRSNGFEENRYNDDIAWQRDELQRLANGLIEDAVRRYIEQFLNVNEGPWGWNESFKYIEALYNDYVKELRGEIK